MTPHRSKSPSAIPSFLIGKVAQYRGLTEFTPLKMDTVNFKVLKHNAVIPKPKVITVSQYVANPEAYEGSLIEIDTLYYSSGTWPATVQTGTCSTKRKPALTAFRYL